MHGESRKIVLTGIVVSAVAIAAYVSHAAKPWLSTDEFGAARDDAPVHQTRGDTISGAVISAPAASRSEETNVAGMAATTGGSLQAARDSLQRNDLAAAQAQLDAVRSSHQDDAQVRVLQRGVQARADTAQRAARVDRAEKSLQPASKPARTSVSAIRHGRSHESRVASREPARGGAKQAGNQAALDRLVAGLDSDSAPTTRTATTGGASATTQPTAPAPVPKPPQSASSASIAAPATPGQPATQTPPAVATLPAHPQAELAAQTTILATPVVQSASSGDTVVRTDGGPKTRAQVRAEIERARENGSLPAFGNPDPAGPGGAPSLNGAPRP